MFSPQIHHFFNTSKYWKLGFFFFIWSSIRTFCQVFILKKFWKYWCIPFETTLCFHWLIFLSMVEYNVMIYESVPNLCIHTGTCSNYSSFHVSCWSLIWRLAVLNLWRFSINITLQHYKGNLLCNVTYWSVYCQLDRVEHQLEGGSLN